MSMELIGFHLSRDERGIFAIYNKPCEEHLDRNVNVHTDSDFAAAALRMTPDEIIQLPESEITRLRSLFLPSKKCRPGARECHCFDIVEIISIDTPQEEHITYIGYCMTQKDGFSGLLRKKSWCCPFCRAIIWEAGSFHNHIEQVHKGGSRGTVIDQSFMGGVVCVLCDKVFHRGAVLPGNVEWRGKITMAELYGRIQNNWKRGNGRKMLEEYAIRNNICLRCIQWIEEKKLEIPASLGELKHAAIRKLDLYPLEVWIPGNVPRKSFQLLELGSIEDYDENSQFFVDLLKQDMLAKINESVFGESQRLYCSLVWDRMLYMWDWGLARRRFRTLEEIKATAIPGAKVLARIQTEIALLEGALIETGVLPPLCDIIRSYLPWQLWSVERFMSRIQRDVMRYAPSLVTLLARVGLPIDKQLIFF